MVAKYKLKVAVVEAIQYSNDMRVNDCLPEGVWIVPWDTKDVPEDQPVVHTSKGDRLVREGDWIITDAIGERIVCGKTEFTYRYEKVEE